MKRTLMATGAALLLAAATFSIPSDASAQNRHGMSGGPNISAGGGPRISGGSSGGTRNFSFNRGSNFSVNRGSNFSVNRGGNFRFNRGHFARRFRGPGVGFAFASPYFYDDYGYDDCYEWRRIHTRYGWRTVRVNVCY